jgi:hypothetical protein
MNSKFLLLLVVFSFIFLLTFVSAEVQHYSADQKDIQILIPCTTPDCQEYCRIRLTNQTGYAYFAGALMSSGYYPNQLNLTITSHDQLLSKGTYKYLITCTNQEGAQINQISSSFIIAGNFEWFTSFNVGLILVIIGVLIIIIVFIKKKRDTSW